jgi:hypothetical protein
LSYKCEEILVLNAPELNLPFRNYAVYVELENAPEFFWVVELYYDRVDNGSMMPRRPMIC